MQAHIRVGGQGSQSIYHDFLSSKWLKYTLHNFFSLDLGREKKTLHNRAIRVFVENVLLC